MRHLPQRVWLVVGTFLLSVILYIDRACISVAQGSIRHDLSLTEQQMGLVMSAFALGYALCQTPTGMLADRFGPRRILTVVVVLWSLFTGLTGAVTALVPLLIVRLFFGAGEAGAFPGIARSVYSWFPISERGLVQGINFSGARIGAAFALPAMAVAVKSLGWRMSFLILMLIGFAWAVPWFLWFRDEPEDHLGVQPEELEYIQQFRQETVAASAVERLRLLDLARSPNVWLLCAQYFSTSSTLFFCLSWLQPHLEKTYQLSSFVASLYAAAPLLCGAAGNWISGWLLDHIYRSGHWTASRRVPAMTGYLLAAVGLMACARASTPLGCAVWMSLAVLGSDMAVSPSWSVCIDIGRRSSGMVSGTMNMVGNFGSFATGLAYPQLVELTGSHRSFFYVAAGLSFVAMILWLRINPQRPLERRT